MKSKKKEKRLITFEDYSYRCFNNVPFDGVNRCLVNPRKKGDCTTECSEWQKLELEGK
jgi:hypothetical protein